MATLRKTRRERGSTTKVRHRYPEKDWEKKSTTKVRHRYPEKDSERKRKHNQGEKGRERGNVHKPVGETFTMLGGWLRGGKNGLLALK